MMHQHTQVWLKVKGWVITAAASIRSSWSLFQICGGFLAKSSFPVSVSNWGNNYRTSVGRPQWDAETATEDHRLVFVLKPQWLKKWAAVFFLEKWISDGLESSAELWELEWWARVLIPKRQFVWELSPDTLVQHTDDESTDSCLLWILFWK